MDPAPFRLDGRIPIVIGVTGHRDPVREPELERDRDLRAAVTRELVSLLEEYPHSPLLVLTALAEGSDTIVAEVAVALARDPRRWTVSGVPRIGVAAVLPMPIESYATDFVDAGHEAHVMDLLRQAAVSYSLSGAAKAADEAGGRRACYARLASYIVRHSHVLLALWDGRQGEPGGTGDVVRWFRQGVPEEFYPERESFDVLRAADGVRFVHLPVSRRGEPTDAGPPPSPSRVEGSAELVLSQIEEFNRDSANSKVAMRGTAAGSRQLLGLPSGTETSSWTPDADRLAPFLEVFAQSDALARRFRSRRRAYTFALFGLAFLALAAFECYSHLKAGPWLLLTYLIAFLLSFSIVGHARSRKIENKFLVYRSLAEALRVQIAWSGGSVRASVADYYQPLHEDEIAWVRHSLKGLAVLARESSEEAESRSAWRVRPLRWALHWWIKREVAWFNDRLDILHSEARRSKLGFHWGAWTGFGMAALLLVLESAHAVGLGVPVLPHGPILVAVVLLVAAGALAQAYGHQEALESSARRYRSALEVFRRAEIRVEQAIEERDGMGVERAASALRSLGRESLAENVGWLLLNRDHELHVKTGG